MRILHVTSRFAAPLGGAEQYCLALAGAQVATGHEVTILASRVDTASVMAAEQLGVAVVARGPWRPYQPGEHGPSWPAKAVFHGADLLDRRGIDSWIDTTKFDIAHVHRFQGYGASLLRRGAVPVVHTVHDYALVDTHATSARRDGAPHQLGLPQRLRARVTSRLAATTDLIFPSARTRDRHHALGLRIRPEREHVLPHGWSLEARPRERRQCGTVRFCYLGKLTREKGVGDLLAAWGQGVPGAALTIAGSGELRDAVLRAADDGVLSYLGWVGAHEKAALLGDCDVLMMTSRWPENFPLAVAEGVLARMAMVSSEAAAPPLFERNVNGLQYSDVDGLREAMLALARDRQLLLRFQEASREISRRLDMKAHVEAVLEIYSAAIGRT